MFRVTVATLCLRVDGVHSAVLGQEITHLCGDICMAGDTAVIHGSRLPWGGMTGPAVTGDFGMGGNAAQRQSPLRIERAGAEHRPAARKGISRDGKSRHQRGEYASPRQTT